MKAISLPFLLSDTPVRNSLKAMRWQEKSAVIRETIGDLALLTAGDIFQGLASQSSFLNDLVSNNPVHRLTAQEVKKWKLDTRNPDRTESEYNSFFNLIVADYLLVDSVPGTALVVTRHETLAFKYGHSPKDCYCLGPDQHEFPPPSVSSGSSCDRCGQPVHCDY
jgi:hypothetical protein